MALSLYFDESGYTGRALLDPVQPHFVLASSVVDDDEARDLMADVFPDFAGVEYKASEIWRRPRARARLQRFAERVGPMSDRIVIHHIDKRFCVLTKLVDSLVEPVLRQQGYDFYAEQYAPRYCNWLHFGLTRVAPKGMYEAVIDPFYRFARAPTEASLVEMTDELRAVAGRLHEPMRSAIALAVQGGANFHRHSDIEAFRNVLEVHVTSVLASIGEWQVRLPNDRFDIRHDASSSFFGNAEVWELLTAQDVPQQYHDFKEGGLLEFPLRVDSTVSTDSAASRAVQFVDLVAGSTARLLAEPANREAEQFRVRLIESGFGELSLNGVRPGMEMIEGPPARRRGPDAVDRLMPILGARN